MRKRNFKIHLYIPPAYDVTYPPLGTPALLAFLKERGVVALQEDLNIAFIDYVIKYDLSNMCSEECRHEKITNKVYYYRELLRRDAHHHSYEVVPGSSFEFTEKMLSSKHLLRYIDDNKENIYHNFVTNKLLQRIKRAKPDMIGLSITSPAQVVAAFTVARIVKSELPNIKIVIGGYWVSFFKEELAKRSDFGAFLDFMIFGEGETPLCLLIDSLRNKRPLSRVPNLAYKDESEFIVSDEVIEEDMNKLPCPDFDGLPLKKYGSYVTGKSCSLTFEVSRGCYWNKCTFCADLIFPKPTYREKKVELLIRDVRKLKRKYGAKRFAISSPVFAPRHLKEFCKELINKKLRINWWAWTRLDNAISKEVLRLVKKAGCTSLGAGLESMNQRVLNSCAKGIKAPVAKRIIADASSVKLRLGLQVILGLPGETSDEALETIMSLLKNPAGAGFNSFYLMPQNYIFNNPEKYGIEIKKAAKLPFRFFYPFRNTPGTVGQKDAEKMKSFYDMARSYNDNTVGLSSRAKKFLNTLGVDEIIKYGGMVFNVTQFEGAGRHDKALGILKKLQAAFPESAYLHYRLCENYFYLGQYDLVRDEAQKALDLGWKREDVALLLEKCTEELAGKQKTDKTHN